jgi:hypothetical protein
MHMTEKTVDPFGRGDDGLVSVSVKAIEMARVSVHGPRVTSAQRETESRKPG